jgi:hypothetical protein
MRTLSCLVALAAVAFPGRGEEKVDTAKAEEQARVIGKALLDADWTKVADLTHPRIIELAGGKDKTIERIETGMKQIKAQGYSLTGYKVGTAQAPLASGKTVYVVVPTSLEIAGPGSRIVTDSYLLGVSDDGGKTWAFADGAGLSDPAKRKTIFPDLPKDLKLPDRKPPVVTKD